MKPAARRWLMLSPALGVIGVLFVGGLALAAAQSFGYFAPTGENAFTLRHYAALETAEIAEILRIPHGTVRSRLHQAHRVMRAALDADARVAVATEGTSA